MSVRRKALDRIVETTIYLQTESRRLAREQCERLGITATQLSIVDRMVAAKLVAREQSPDDRRVWRIRLTGDGKAIAKRIQIAPWDILRAAVMALPAVELDQLVTTLVKVADNVEKMIAKETR